MDLDVGKDIYNHCSVIYLLCLHLHACLMYSPLYFVRIGPYLRPASKDRCPAAGPWSVSDSQGSDEGLTYVIVSFTYVLTDTYIYIYTLLHIYIHRDMYQADACCPIATRSESSFGVVHLLYAEAMTAVLLGVEICAFSSLTKRSKQNENCRN